MRGYPEARPPRTAHSGRNRGPAGRRQRHPADLRPAPNRHGRSGDASSEQPTPAARQPAGGGGGWFRPTGGPPPAPTARLAILALPGAGPATLAGTDLVVLVLTVEDGAIATPAGVSAVVDLCLEAVRRHPRTP